MTTKWNPADYKDERSKLRKITDDQIARQSGKKVKAMKTSEEAEAPDATTNVVDFMALLKRSLEKNGQGGAALKSARKATQRRTRSTRRKAS
jgi:DNA end-binding protein Ku